MPKTLDSGINIYSKEEYPRLKEAAHIASEVLKDLILMAQPGATTWEMESYAEEVIRAKKAQPAFKGFHGYPYCTCISVNNHIVHGAPSNRKLEVNDVISIDVGIVYNGYYSDNARTVILAPLDPYTNNHLIIDVARNALEQATMNALPGKTLGDVGYAIQRIILAPKYKNKPLFKIFSDFQGHGIGLNLHEPPNVLNVGYKGKGQILLPGMSICVEPVIMYRTSDVMVGFNPQTGVNDFMTTDGKASSHFENHILITDSGPETLTEV